MNSFGKQRFFENIGLVVFVAIFATAGVTYLIASHADSCTTGSTGSSACLPVDTAASTDTPAAATTKEVDGNCTIAGVPADPTVGEVIQPVVTMNNTGLDAFSSQTDTSLALFDTKGTSTAQTKLVPIPTIASKGSYTFKLDAYTVPAKSATAVRGTYTIDSPVPVFSCSTSFNLPARS